MKTNRVYITIYGDIKEQTAVRYAAELLKELPNKEGVAKWRGGICAGFNNTAKYTSIQVWEDK